MGFGFLARRAGNCRGGASGPAGGRYVGAESQRRVILEYIRARAAAHRPLACAPAGRLGSCLGGRLSGRLGGRCGAWLGDRRSGGAQALLGQPPLARHGPRAPEPEAVLAVVAAQVLNARARVARGLDVGVRLLGRRTDGVLGSRKNRRLRPGPTAAPQPHIGPWRVPSAQRSQQPGESAARRARPREARAARAGQRRGGGAKTGRAANMPRPPRWRRR